MPLRWNKKLIQRLDIGFKPKEYNAPLPNMNLYASFSDLVYVKKQRRANELRSVRNLYIPLKDYEYLPQFSTDMYCVFRNLYKKEVIVSFTGTRLPSKRTGVNWYDTIDDLIDDAGIVLDMNTFKIDAEIDAIVLILKQNFSSYDITLTGHSRGGYVAYVTSFRLNKQRIGKSIDLITYNAGAGLPFNPQTILNLREFIQRDSPLRFHYMILGDPISFANIFRRGRPIYKKAVYKNPHSLDNFLFDKIVNNRIKF